MDLELNPPASAMSAMSARRRNPRLDAETSALIRDMNAEVAMHTSLTSSPS